MTTDKESGTPSLKPADQPESLPRSLNPSATSNPWATSQPKFPAPSGTPDPPTPPVRSSEAEVADFVAKVRAMGPVTGTETGRLMFAMDATMSRQPTWDLALSLQGEMFQAVKDVGGLTVQLVYFRGHDECRSSRWVADPQALARLMSQIACQGGNTQIGRVLTHARQEMQSRRVHALVYVGDCMEESIDTLCSQAGELGILGLPLFLFQEGDDRRAEIAFREMARLSRGAYCRFDQGAARQLRELLTAVAAYAAGGRKALERIASRPGGAGAQLLIEQLRK